MFYIKRKYYKILRKKYNITENQRENRRVYGKI